MTTIDTQLQAYAAIKDKRTYWRNKLRAALQAHPQGLTTEDICWKTYLGYNDVKPLKMNLAEMYKSMQPRTSEAHEELEIFDTGIRKPNKSGKKAIVWAMVTNDEQKQLAVKQTLKKMKPIGDAKLFGEMMRAIYAQAAQDTQENLGAAIHATTNWRQDMVQNIRKSKFSADLPQVL